MRRILVSLSVILSAVACSHTTSVTQAPSRISIPDVLQFQVPKSVPLTAAEQQMFQTFLTTQAGITHFAPQTYVFSNAAQTSLTQDQQTFLTQIQNQCLSSAMDPTAKPSAPVGSPMISADTQSIQGENCPITFTSDMVSSMTVQDLDTKTPYEDGTGSVMGKDSLAVVNNNATAAAVLALTSQTDTTNASFKFVMDGTSGTTKIYVTNTNTQAVAATAGYSVSTDSQTLITENTNDTTAEVTLNMTFRVAGIAEPVIVSLMSASTGNGDSTNVGYVNGVEMSADDLNTLSANAFLQAQITLAMQPVAGLSASFSSSGSNAKLVAAAAKAHLLRF